MTEHKRSRLPYLLLTALIFAICAGCFRWLIQSSGQITLTSGAELE